VTLDAQKAADAANYSAERWSYQRTANYGSPHFNSTAAKGQDSMRAEQCYCLEGWESVFIGIPDMKPVMQMRLGWALATSDGAAFEQNTYFTPYELARFDPVAEALGH